MNFKPNKNASISLPIEFSKIEQETDTGFYDERFMNVKIWIAHTGENRNNSIFTREVLESMIPTLSNIPILGFIANESEDLEESDFRNHEKAIVKTNNGIGLRYMGHAYGVIPSDNNARFESRYGEDGVEREYLVCEGLIWRKFADAVSIFDRDMGYKNQSMELLPSKTVGYFNDEGLFVFTQAVFEGACILGEDVTPAMISSTIEQFSVSSKDDSNINEILEEISKNADFSMSKEDCELDKEKQIIQEEQAEFEEKEEHPAEESNEQSGQSEKEDFADDKDDEEDEEEDEEEDKEKMLDDENEDKNKKEYSVTFSLSHDDIRSKLYEALRDEENDSEDMYDYSYIMSVYDTYFIVENNDKYFKRFYVKHENAVSLGDKEEVFPSFLTQAEKTALEASRIEFSEIKQEVESLREFKANAVMEEKKEKLSQYASVLDEENFNAISDKLSDFSLEDIEKEVGFILLKSNQFSVGEESTPARVGIAKKVSNGSVDQSRYGELGKYFYKK